MNTKHEKADEEHISQVGDEITGQELNEDKKPEEGEGIEKSSYIDILKYPFRVVAKTKNN